MKVPGTLTSDIQIRPCHTLAEYDDCIDLQHRVWGEDIVVPSPIFVVADHTGGITLGAFEGNRMIGFSLALAGIRPSADRQESGESAGHNFWHSHMTAVLPEYQNAGIGRRLKLAQREEALRRGIGLIEWTFDPLELKNAHFNFVRLGAVARRFIPNCYGVTQSPLHAGLPTDRLLAEWWLDSPHVRKALADSGSAASKLGSRANSAIRISLPSSLAHIRSRDPKDALRIQSDIRTQFERWFARDYAAVSLEQSGEFTEYILVPRDSIPGLPLPALPAE